MSTTQLEVLLGLLLDARYDLDSCQASKAYIAIKLMEPSFEEGIDDARRKIETVRARIITLIEEMKYERREKRQRNRRNRRMRNAETDVQRNLKELNELAESYANSCIV